MNNPIPSILLTEPTLQAWPRWLTSHRSWLGAVIFARVRDRCAVEEILQETALAAIASELPTDAQGLSRWLYRVAIRQSALYRRQRGRNKKKCAAYADTAMARTRERAVTGNPCAILEASEQTALVREAIQRLGNGDCEILLLKYTEDWSCQEIAAQLGVSVSAIKSRLLRARANLRRELLQISETWEVP